MQARASARTLAVLTASALGACGQTWLSVACARVLRASDRCFAVTYSDAETPP